MKHPFQRAPVWFALALLIICGAAITGYFAMRQAEEVDGWVQHTHEVIDTVNDIARVSSTVQRSGHDYVLTGDERFLQPYHEGLERIYSLLARLDIEVKDNPAQAERARTLRLKLRELSDLLAQQVYLRRDNAFDRARDLVLMQAPGEKSGGLGRVLDEMKSGEERLLAERTEHAAQARRLAILLGACGLLANVLITGLVFEMLRRENKHRKDMQSELTEVNEKMAASLRQADVTAKRLSKTVENIPLGVLVTDSELRVVTFNDTLMDMLGAPEGAIKPGDELEKIWLFGMDRSQVSEEDRARLTERRRDLIENPKPYRFERIHRNGRLLEARGTPVPGGGFVKIYTDITKQRAEARRLMEERDTAEELARAKSEFLAVMSHEVRTPMNGVMGIAGLLRDTDLNPEQKNYVDIIVRSGESLLTILNDILDLSKVEANKMELETEPFNPKQVMGDLIALWGPRASEKGLSIALRAQDAYLPRCLVGDAGRLRQVLSNLIGNAVKFTEHGGITIDARLISQDRDGVTLGFSVTDTGIGISAEQRARLFQPFTQADVSTTRKFGGTGLGLAISQRLVEMMGGSFDVFSQEGHGSVFSFTSRFRLGDEKALPESAVTEPVADAAFSGCVLVVEDHPVNRAVARASLTRLGLTVREAVNGSEAVGMVERGGIDLVFMDMHMPVMDGMEATRLIRVAEEEEGNVRHIPIVAMTANVMPEAVGVCVAAGMDGFLCKPFSRGQLLEALEHWLPGATPRSQAPAVPAAPVEQQVADREPSGEADDTQTDMPFQVPTQALADADHGADEGIDLPLTLPEAPSEPVKAAAPAAPAAPARDKLEGVINRKRYALMEDTMGDEIDDLLNNFHTTTAQLIPSIQVACTAGDWDRAFRDAHTLCSGAAMIGAESLSSLARSIEVQAKAGGAPASPGLAAQLDREYARVREALAAMTADHI